MHGSGAAVVNASLGCDNLRRPMDCERCRSLDTRDRRCMSRTISPDDPQISVTCKRVGSPSWDLNPGVFCSRAWYKTDALTTAPLRLSQIHCFTLSGRAPASLCQPALWGSTNEFPECVTCTEDARNEGGGPERPHFHSLTTHHTRCYTHCAPVA